MKTAPRAADPLFVGLTRPAMVAGVTYEALILELMITLIVFIATKNPLWLLLFIPLHAVCYAICALDPRAFQLIALWGRTKGACLTRGFWRSAAYSPLRTERRP